MKRSVMHLGKQAEGHGQRRSAKLLAPNSSVDIALLERHSAQKIVDSHPNLRVTLASQTPTRRCT